MKVLNREGQEVEVADKDAQAALTSGQFGLPAGTRVPVKTANGQIGTVPIEGLGHAAAAGAKLISQDEYDQHKYGSGTDAVLAGIEGAAQGATFDLATPALVHATEAVNPEFSKKLAKDIRGRAKANPTAHFLGEGAGMLGMTALTEGLGAGAEAARGAEAAPEAAKALAVAGEASPFRTAAPEIAERLAAGAESVPASLAEGVASHAAKNAAEENVAENLGSTGQSLLAKLMAHTATGAAMGGAQGAGDALTEDALSPTHDLTAQKFLTQAGEGALFGGLGGAALGGAIEGSKAAIGKLAPRASKLAEEQAFRSLFASADKKSVEEAEALPGGFRAVARRLLDEGAIQSGDKWSDILPRVEKLEGEAADQVHQFRTVLDKAGAAGPSTGRILEDFTTRMGDRFKEMPDLFKGPMSLMRTLSEGVAKRGESMTFQETQDLKRAIDNQITSWSKAVGAPDKVDNMAVLKAFRASLESEAERAGDAAAKEMGGAFIEPYREAKLAYRQTRVALNALERSDLKSSNRAVSPSDYFAGIGGGVMGLATRGLADALGFHVPGIGFAAAMGHKLVRERGNATAAILLDKMAALGGLQEAIARNDREVARGVSQLYTPGKRVAPKLRISGSTTEQRMQWVEKHLTGQAAPASHVAGPLEAHAPKVANALSAAGDRAVAYLANLLPKPQLSSPLDPQPKKIKPRNLAEEAKFNRAYDAITGGAPLLLQHINDGMLTKDEVDAFKAVHKDAYSELCDKIVKDAATAKKPLPFQKKVQLSILLGQPVTPMMSASYIEDVLLKPAQSGGPGGSSHATHGMSAPRIKPPKDIAKATMLTGLDKGTFLPQ